VWNGSAAWIPSFFIRNFGWSAAQVGYRFGFIVLIFGTVGIITGGLISTWLRHRGKTDSNISVGVLAALLALPTGALAPLSSDPIICLMIYAGFVFACSLPYGCAAAAFQEITPNQMRAQVTAVYFLVLNLAGIGLGSTVVALITERVFGDDAAVKLSLALVALIAAPLAALILWWSRAPYMRCFAEQNPDNGAGARLR
jgi:MFS family permease